MAAARALLALAAAALAAHGVISDATAEEHSDLDEESDSAAFMIVVEHEGEWRCSASLVSQRTAVTTARCALGRSAAPREVWALASALLAARPPAPPAAAARRVRRLALAAAAPGALALAVLELEAPFGVRARVRPILLATSQGECERAQHCNAVRALEARRPAPVRRLRLRVVDVRRAAAARCAAHLLHWPAAPDRLECYAGDELCEIDLGGGVVCDGKLCSVLGETVVDAVRCSDTYATLAVAHWRRFLHCAHTLRLCGRGDCATLCSERRLIPDEGDDNVTYVYQTPVRTGVTQIDLTTSILMTSRQQPVKSSRAPTRTSPRAAPTTAFTVSTAVDTLTRRPAAVFEPNRADFKVGQTRSTLVRLKAGEYGDNAADYDGEEPPPPTRTAAPAAAPAPAPARTPAAAPAPAPAAATRTPPALALERRVSPPARSVAHSVNTRWKFNVANVIFNIMVH